MASDSELMGERTVSDRFEQTQLRRQASFSVKGSTPLARLQTRILTSVTSDVGVSMLT